MISFSFHSYTTRRLCCPRLPARCSKPPSFSLRSHRPEISEQFFIFNQLCTLIILLLLLSFYDIFNGMAWREIFLFFFSFFLPLPSDKKSCWVIRMEERQEECLPKWRTKWSGGRESERLAVEGEQGLIESRGPYRQSTPVWSIAWAFFAFIHEWVGSGGGTIKTIAHSLIPKRTPSPRCLSPTGPSTPSREKKKDFFFSTWSTPHKTKKKGKARE